MIGEDGRGWPGGERGLMAVYDAYVRADRLTETRLFLSLIRFNGLQESDAGALSAGEGVNWRHVVRLAKRHGTAPLLYRNVKRLGLGPRLPADVLDGLRVSYLCTAGRNIRLGRKLVRVVDALEDRGIPAAPFKGPVMAQCLYGDLTLRCYGDLDILVPRKAAIDAREAMASMGCRFLGPNIGRHQFGAAQTLEKAFNFTTGDGNVAIDLHWRLNRQVRYAYDYEFCRERLTTATIENREVACLSPEDMVVYLCVHGATHGWDRVELALCIAEYIQRYPALDWKLALSLAASIHCRKMLLLGLFLARDLFHSPLPVAVSARIEKDRAIEKAVGRIYPRLFGKNLKRNRYRDMLTRSLLFMRMRDRGVDKLWYGFLLLAAPSTRDWRDLPLPPRLFFLFYFLRPFTWAVAKVRAGLTKRWPERCPDPHLCDPNPPRLPPARPDAGAPPRPALAPWISPAFAPADHPGRPGPDR